MGMLVKLVTETTASVPLGRKAPGQFCPAGSLSQLEGGDGGGVVRLYPASLPCHLQDLLQGLLAYAAELLQDPEEVVTELDPNKGVEDGVEAAVCEADGLCHHDSCVQLVFQEAVLGEGF